MRGNDGARLVVGIIGSIASVAFLFVIGQGIREIGFGWWVIGPLIGGALPAFVAYWAFWGQD